MDVSNIHSANREGVRFFQKVATAFLFFLAISLHAQQPQQRMYADTQANNHSNLPLTPSVTFPTNAIDGDMQTHSSLSITLVGTVWQRLSFSNAPDPNQDVHIKVGTSVGLLSALGNIELQAFNGTTAVGSAMNIPSLLSLLDGETQADIVFPAPGVAYDGIRVYSSGVALANPFYVYGAYYLEDTTNVTCNESSDYLYGSTGNLLGGLNPVDDPENAVDGDYTTYANLNANVSALNKTFVTALYDTPAQAGDSIRVVVESPAGLLDLSLLASNFTLRTYYDNTDNGALALDASLLNVQLLSGSSGVYIITYPVNVPFNRIELSLGEGLVSALDNLYVYSIEKLPAGPELVVVEPTAAATDLCVGEELTLAVENPQGSSTYHWYSDSGTTLLHTGDSYTTPINTPGLHSFYVSETREGCTDASGFAYVGITAHNPPLVPTTAHPVQRFCKQKEPTIGDIDMNEPQVLWYASELDETPLDPTDELTENQTLYAALANDYCESERLAIDIVIRDCRAVANPILMNFISKN